MMFAFDIAMQHICTDPFLDFVDYDKLHATSHFGAYTVSHGTAVPELRKLRAAATMQWGLEVAMVKVCRRPFLQVDDYRAILSTSSFGADILSGVLAVMVYTHFLDDSGSESS